MISDELIKNFFEEQFEDISPFFLYKDHQLLKDNKFQEFIERQLIKSRNRFIFGIICAIAGFILGLTYFWFYFETSEIVHVINALFWIVMGAGSLFWFSKQYFIISSSMSLFQKMLTKQNTKSV
jgi:type IV secretory pathway VirB3-like protein